MKNWKGLFLVEDFETLLPLAQPAPKMFLLHRIIITCACLIRAASANIINLPSSHRSGTPVGGPRLLWQLSWVLFRTHVTCCHCINRLTVFPAQSSILGNRPSHPVQWWPLLLGTQSAVSTGGSVARAVWG